MVAGVGGATMARWSGKTPQQDQLWNLAAVPDPAAAMVLVKDEDELYTPEDTDVKCARDTMICFMREIGALAQEHEKTTIQQTIGKIQRNIGAALKDIAAQTNACPPCESYELQKTTTFLERMIQFVQFALNDNGLKEH
uniref:Uncharacterized protein n=1 Tax=Sphaerodactylus townsendi TaxID=933632 RepID=A0ACB8E7V1_9SAUR